MDESSEMMAAVSVVVAVLAVNQIVEIWRHSSLFEGWQDRLEGVVDNHTTFPPFWYAAKMLTCPWCFSVWAAGGALLAVHYGYEWILWPFGVSRAANLINDLTYTFNRTPKSVEGVTLDP